MLYLSEQAFRRDMLELWNLRVSSHAHLVLQSAEDDKEPVQQVVDETPFRRLHPGLRHRHVDRIGDGSLGDLDGNGCDVVAATD